MRIRLAHTEDVLPPPEIREQRIPNRLALFHQGRSTAVGRRDTTAAPADRYPALVAESDDGQVLGWAALSEHSPLARYRGIAECSVHVNPANRGRGVGTMLMAALVAEAARQGTWKLISRVFVSNEPSRALCLRAGFREVGVLERHARLDGRWTDVLIVERLIPENQG